MNLLWDWEKKILYSVFLDHDFIIFLQVTFFWMTKNTCLSELDYHRSPWILGYMVGYNTCFCMFYFCCQEVNILQTSTLLQQIWVPIGSKYRGVRDLSSNSRIWYRIGLVIFYSLSHFLLSIWWQPSMRYALERVLFARATFLL